MCMARACLRKTRDWPMRKARWSTCVRSTSYGFLRCATKDGPTSLVSRSPNKCNNTPRRGASRHTAWDWQAWPERDVLVTGLLCTRPGLCFLFLSPSWGCVSTLSGLRLGFFFAFILSGSPPPFYHPASGFIGVPPRKSGYGIRTGAPFGLCLPIQRHVTTRPLSGCVYGIHEETAD